MSKNLKCLPFRKKWRLHILFPLILVSLIGILLFFELKTPAVEADFEVISNQNAEVPRFSVIQNNSLSPISNPLIPQDNLIVIEQISVIVTGYSSSPEETDSSPRLTAAGTWVRDGVIANNMLPFGTKVRIPEIYDDKIFVVEDRMSLRKGNFHIDIWFPNYWQALNFGAKRTYIEILEG